MNVFEELKQRSAGYGNPITLYGTSDPAVVAAAESALGALGALSFEQADAAISLLSQAIRLAAVLPAKQLPA